MNETVVACLLPDEAQKIYDALNAAFRRNGRLPYELREFRAMCWHQAQKERKPCGNPSPNIASGDTSPPA